MAARGLVKRYSKNEWNYASEGNNITIGTSILTTTSITQVDRTYPPTLKLFLGGHAPDSIFALGNLDILK